MPSNFTFPDTEYWRAHDVLKVTWKSHNSDLSLQVPSSMFWPFLTCWLVPWGCWAWAQPGDILMGIWILCESCIFTPFCLPPHPPFFPTDPDTSWELGMAFKDGRDPAFPWPCREAGMDSDLLLSLEKVVSQAPGFPFRALSFGVMSLLHFPSHPLLSFIAPTYSPIPPSSSPSPLCL